MKRRTLSFCRVMIHQDKREWARAGFRQALTCYPPPFHFTLASRTLVKYVPSLM